MNILSSIMDKIFPGNAKAQASTATQVPDSPLMNPNPGASTMVQPKDPVDVEAVLSGMAKNSSQTLNWQSSIVDLMKLLNLDSSLESRKQLARELNYSGDMSDSAKMNIWLHDQVMQKFAENGGKIPESMKH